MTTAVVTKQPTDIAGLLEANRNALQQALPKTVKIDRFLRVAMNAIARNPDLQKCTAASLYGAIMQSAQFGLEIGLMNQAHLVPYWNSEKRCFEAQFQIGYLGLRDMAEWYGDVEDGDAQVVYELDEFDYELGDSPSITHKPHKGQSRGEPAYYYCWAKPKNGKIKVAVMSRQEVEEHRDKFVRKTKAGDYSPMWTKTFDAAAIKTVIRKCYKLVARSPQLREAIALDELQEVQIPQGLGVEMEQEQLATIRQSNQEKLKQLQQQPMEQAERGQPDESLGGNGGKGTDSPPIPPSDSAHAAPPEGSEGPPPSGLTADLACRQMRAAASLAELSGIMNQWLGDDHFPEEKEQVSAVFNEMKRTLGKSPSRK